MAIYETVPSRIILPTDLKIVGRMYPYETLAYQDLCLVSNRFLKNYFAHESKDTQIACLSNHNGLGRQWGIILMKCPNSPYWRLVAQFGHHAWRIPFTTRYLDFWDFWGLRLWRARVNAWFWRIRHHENHTLEHPRLLENLVSSVQ